MLIRKLFMRMHMRRKVYSEGVGLMGYQERGASSEFQNKEVPPMEHLLLDIIAAVVAGVIVALIVKRLNR